LQRMSPFVAQHLGVHTPVTAFMGKCRLCGRSNQSPGDALFRQPTDGSITSDQHARRVRGMGALHLSGHAAATPPTSETNSRRLSIACPRVMPAQRVESAVRMRRSTISSLAITAFLTIGAASAALEQAWPEPGHPYHQCPVAPAQPQTVRHASQGDIELMSEKEVLYLKPAPRLEQVRDKRADQLEDGKHRAG